MIRSAVMFASMIFASLGAQAVAQDLILDGTEIGTIEFSNYSEFKQTLRVRRCGPASENRRLKIGPRGRRSVILKSGESWTVNMSAGCYVLSGWTDDLDLSDRRFVLRPNAQGTLRYTREPDAPRPDFEFVSDNVYFGAPF